MLGQPRTDHKRIDFFGETEIVNGSIAVMVGAAPIILTFPVYEDTAGYPGNIEIHQRQANCLSYNVHDPRPYIVCWSKGGAHTDISFHSSLGGDHGALQEFRSMFERYTKHLTTKGTSL